MLRALTLVLLGVAYGSIVYAEPSEADIKLAVETEKYCASTASTKATPQLIMKKIDEAAVLVEKKGKAAFKKFKGKNSPFIFAGTYIWVNDLDGIMLMHPLKPGMNGKNLIGLKDSNGKRFFVDMISLCKKNGSGWVDYMWPKPGEKKRSLKISYVKKVTCDGKDIIIGCGTYDMTMEEVKAALADK